MIAVDMTFGATTASADYAVAQVWGSVGAARFLLEQWRGRATQMEQRNAIKMLARKYPGAKVVIEKAAGGPGTIEQLNADGIPNIVPVTTGGRGKAERLAVVSPTIEGGNAILPLGAPWLGDYVEELAGATRHDDMQDATAYALAELNAGGMDQELAEKRRTFRRGVGAMLSDQYRGAELAARIEHACENFDRRHRGEPERAYAPTADAPARQAEHARPSPLGENVLPGRWRTI